MLPLVALPTSVQYRDLKGLEKLSWDTYVKQPDNVRDIIRVKELEEEMEKLVSDLSKRESEKRANFVLNLASQNNYELLTTWQERANLEATPVFLAVKPKGTPRDGGEKLIPLEYDHDAGIAGINLQNNQNFDRIDVGIEDNCYYSEANDVQEFDDCYNSQYLWEIFDGTVRVVYGFPDGTLFTLYTQDLKDEYILPYQIPLDTDYEAYNEYKRMKDEYEDEYGDEEMPPDLKRFNLDKLVIYGQYYTDEVRIPNGLGKSEKFVVNNQSDWVESSSPRRPLMSPVFAMDRRDMKREMQETESGFMTISEWYNIGLFYYAIPIDVLTSIVQRFETLNKVKDPAKKRVREK